MDGVTWKSMPLPLVPRNTPPDMAVNQLMLFPVEVAFSWTGAPGQAIDGVAVTLVGAVQG